MTTDEVTQNDDVNPVDLQDLLRECDLDLSIEQIQAILQLLDEAGSVQQARDLLDRIDRAA